MKIKPKMIDVPIQDLEALKLRLSEGASLDKTDTSIILSILNVYQWMYVQLGAAKLTLHRLTKMLGFDTEKRKKSSKKNEGKGNKTSDTSTEDENSMVQLPFQGAIIDGGESPEKKF